MSKHPRPESPAKAARAHAEARTQAEAERAQAEQAEAKAKIAKEQDAAIVGAYLHRSGTATGLICVCGRSGARPRACAVPSLSPDRCHVPASGRPGQGARSARGAAPQAPLTRLSGSGSWGSRGREAAGWR